MKSLKDYLVEGKVIEVNFKKKQDDKSKNNMKNHYNALADVIDGIRENIKKTDKTSTILFLLVSALKEMKTYIDEEPDLK